MERVSFVLKIDPSDYEEYVLRHQQVYPELEEQFAEVGIKSYHIFFHEGTLYAYMLVDDFDAAMQRLAIHPSNVKWQAFMSDLLKPWENGEMVKRIPKVYSFET